MDVVILIPKGWRRLKPSEVIRAGDYWLQRNDDLQGHVPDGEPEYVWEPIDPSWCDRRPIRPRETSMQYWIRPT